MKTLIKNVRIVNEGLIFSGEVLVDGERIAQVVNLDNGESSLAGSADAEVDGEGKLLVPGVVDDQVHFREPGFTHKGNIKSESRAALAGGTTSLMEMPNTVPQTTTIELLEDKFSIAAETCPVNHSFYFGATNDNIEEIRKIDPKRTCGLKVFMGSSTGNMLVDNPESLKAIFNESPVIIATHCEDSPTIFANEDAYKEKYGEEVPFALHGEIRSREACYKSSSLAVKLAKETGARLHVLHLSTAEEIELFTKGDSKDKQITAEVCVHHLFFTDEDYKEKGSLIKWNPAVKKQSDRDALRQALKDGYLEVVATDHAPHTLEEKGNTYYKAPSGAPLVQFSLITMLEMARDGVFDLELVVRKMSHAPADLFDVKDRGYIREGYYADLVLVDDKTEWTLKREDVLSLCGWSPLEGQVFHNKVEKVWVNGTCKVEGGAIVDETPGMALEFNR